MRKLFFQLHCYTHNGEDAVFVFAVIIFSSISPYCSGLEGTMPTLAIVAPDDRPVFEASFPQPRTGTSAVVEQLVLHSSLDMVDEKVI